RAASHGDGAAHRVDARVGVDDLGPHGQHELDRGAVAQYVVEHDPAVLGRGVDRGTVAAYFDGPARPRRGPQGEAPATVRGVAAHADAHAALGGVRRVDLDRGAVRGDGGRCGDGEVEAGRACCGDVMLERCTDELQ